MTGSNRLLALTLGQVKQFRTTDIIIYLTETQSRNKMSTKDLKTVVTNWPNTFSHGEEL